MYTPFQYWLFCEAVRFPYNPVASAIYAETKPTTVLNVDAGSDYGCVFDYNYHAVVAVNGSDDRADWGKNIQFWHSNKHGISKGLYASARLFSVEIARFIKNREKPVYLTGHSRGGALAVAIAFILLHNGYNVFAKPPTFGAQKPGNRKFKRKCQKLGLSPVNYIIDGDPVPKLPVFTGKRVGCIIMLPRQSRNRIENHRLYGQALLRKRLC